MRRLAGLLATTATLLLASCAMLPPAAPPGQAGSLPPRPGEAGGGSAPSGQEGARPLPEANRFTSLAARFTDRALKQEKAGDLRLARDSWKIVAALRPEAVEPKNRVTDLSARLTAEAERHYRNGLARIQECNEDAARHELLLALIANPDHAEALEAIKNRIEKDAVSYTVAAGDTFESIAGKEYADPTMGSCIARINDLDPGSRPAPGAVLSLPGLAPPAAKPAAKRGAEPARDAEAEAPEPSAETGAAGTASPVAPAAPPSATPPTAPQAADPAEAQLERATELFQAKKFEAAAEAAERLADDPTFGTRAREIAASAWFAVGDAMLKEDRFTEAVTAYKKSEPVHKDAVAALAAVERRKKEKAEELYNLGVGFFINQKLDAAIRKWEQTLALNPEHQKAARDIEKARELQQKLKDIR